MQIDDLRKRLQACPNLSDVARRACVSGKSLYRIRNRTQSPTLVLVERIVRALNGEDLRV
jgi:DNA-binding phage protein